MSCMHYVSGTREGEMITVECSGVNWQRAEVKGSGHIKSLKTSGKKQQRWVWERGTDGLGDHLSTLSVVSPWRRSAGSVRTFQNILFLRWLQQKKRWPQPLPKEPQSVLTKTDRIIYGNVPIGAVRTDVVSRWHEMTRCTVFLVRQRRVSSTADIRFTLSYFIPLAEQISFCVKKKKKDLRQRSVSFSVRQRWPGLDIFWWIVSWNRTLHGLHEDQWIV